MPCNMANVNNVPGVCSIRSAPRFCFVRKPDAVFDSPLRTATSASRPAGSFRANKAFAAAKLTSGTSSLSALCSAAADIFVLQIHQAGYGGQPHFHVFIVERRLHLAQVRFPQ